jgi:hypothetical protein
MVAPQRTRGDGRGDCFGFPKARIQNSFTAGSQKHGITGKIRKFALDSLDN